LFVKTAQPDGSCVSLRSFDFKLLDSALATALKTGASVEAEAPDAVKVVGIDDCFEEAPALPLGRAVTDKDVRTRGANHIVRPSLFNMYLFLFLFQ
jgi:hypothetical protein